MLPQRVMQAHLTVNVWAGIIGNHFIGPVSLNTPEQSTLSDFLTA